jgi:hypothetical protein
MSTATRVIRQTRIVKDSAARAEKEFDWQGSSQDGCRESREAEGQKMTQWKRLCP